MSQCKQKIKEKSNEKSCLSPPSSPCCGSIMGDWHCTVQLAAAHVAPQLAGGQGRPWQEPACNPGLLFFPTMKHNSKSSGAEAEGNPLCGVFWQGGCQRRATLCSLEELCSQSPGVRDLGQPKLHPSPLASSHFPPLTALVAQCWHHWSLQFPRLSHPTDCELSILFEG